MTNQDDASESVQTSLDRWFLLIPLLFFFCIAVMGFIPETYPSSFPVNGTIATLSLMTALAFIFSYLGHTKTAVLLSVGSLILTALTLLQQILSWPLLLPIFDRATTAALLCFGLTNITLLLINFIRYLHFNGLATVVALGSFIMTFAGIALIGGVYGIDKTAGLFQINHIVALAFIISGLALIASSWRALTVYGDKETTEWYMAPANICILSASMTYILILVAYPSFRNETNVHPEEMLTIMLLAGIVYYLRKAHTRSKELGGTIKQLNNARDSLINQEKLAALGVLAAGIAHEIKNPLNYIYNFSELAARQIDEVRMTFNSHQSIFSDGEKRELEENFKNLEANIASINKQSARANNTVQRMLLHAHSKPEAMALTDLHSMLEEYLTLSYQGVRVQEPDFNVKIERSFSASHNKVCIHAEGMSRVFLNILNNAYYALINKKKKNGSLFQPILNIKTSMIEQAFEIRIRDNGDGIPKEVGKQIFTPFFTTKPAGEGTGLGLSLSRNIIENEHSGTLTFDSQEGSYTEFIIRLPLKNPVGKPESAAQL